MLLSLDNGYKKVIIILLYLINWVVLRYWFLVVKWLFLVISFNLCKKFVYWLLDLFNVCCFNFIDLLMMFENEVSNFKRG